MSKLIHAFWPLLLLEVERWKFWPYDAIVEWRKEIDFPVEFKTIAKKILISKSVWFAFYSQKT